MNIYMCNTEMYIYVKKIYEIFFEMFFLHLYFCMHFLMFNCKIVNTIPAEIITVTNRK